MAIHWSSCGMSRSLLYWGAQNQTQYSKHVSPVLSREEGTPALACWSCFPNAAQDIVGCLYCKGTLPVRVQLVLHYTYVLPAKLLFGWSDSSMCWCMGLFLPRCRTLHLHLLNCMRFLLAPFSRLSTPFCMAAQQPDISTTPPSFVSSENLLKLHSFLSLMRHCMVKLYGSRYQSLGNTR